MDGEPGTPIPITRDVTVVGRRPVCDVVLNDPSLSKRHCVLVKTDGLLVIRWILPSGTEIDSGVRADDKSLYPRWVAAFDTQTDTEQRNDQ